MSLDFAQPWCLLALLALPLLLPGLRHSLTQFTVAQKRVCTLLRAIILALLALALAGPRARVSSENLSVLYLVDASASISPEAAEKARGYIAESLRSRRAGDEVAIAGFAVQPEMWNAADSASWQPSAALQRQASDIGQALDFAGAVFPAGTARRVVLLSDGNDTGGGAVAAAARLARGGTKLLVVPMRNPESPEVLVERVDVPQRLREGEPFDLAATIRSSTATTAKVRLYQSQFLIAEREMDLKPGVNEFRAPGLRPSGSFVPYEVELLPALDTAAENNRATAVASLRGQPRVLIVDGEPEKARPLADALRAARITVDLRGPTGCPRDLDDLQQYDLFLLSDVSALTLPREKMELYRRWVQDFGGGFVLLGGENSFGVGGYFRTPIEQMLPIRMEHNDRQEMPTVALLVVLDRSGSMTAQVGGQTKMSLANQGAALALNVLGPRDYFGVLAVDTRAHVVAPLAKHGTRETVAQKILAVTAGGGGIYVYTALAESLAALRDIQARIKHVILFSDAADAEEKNAGEQNDGAQGSGTSLELVSAMLSQKITTSVVALGIEQDKDTPFLRQLAERGQGRFYLTSDATTLPQIFSTETMKVAQSSLIEEPTLAIPVVRSAITAGIDWAQSPLLLGYNATKPKPTAEILLATERGEPLLATWRYGLGQTAAFTSDAKARWASEWIAWPGYGKFWAQTVRGLLRQGGPAAFDVLREERGDLLELWIDAVTPEGSFRNRIPVTVTARTPDDQTQSFSARQDAPGRYRATVALPAEGTTVIQVSSPELPDGGIVMAHTRSYPREFLTTGTDEAQLQQIAVAAGGTFAPAAEAVFSTQDSRAWKRKDLTDACLIAALLLIPLDIWLRRRTWRRVA